MCKIGCWHPRQRFLLVAFVVSSAPHVFVVCFSPLALDFFSLFCCGALLLLCSPFFSPPAAILRCKLAMITSRLIWFFYRFACIWSRCLPFLRLSCCFTFLGVFPSCMMYRLPLHIYRDLVSFTVGMSYVVRCVSFFSFFVSPALFCNWYYFALRRSPLL